MKIVHLLSQTHLTGAEAHAVTLAEAHIAAGHDVTLISDRLHLATTAQVLRRPIHGARGWRRWAESWRLRHWLREHRAEVVHAHSRAAVRIAWWATRGTSVALVSTIHGRQHFSWGKRLFDLYGERVIAVCGILKEHLIRDFRMRADRIMVVGNPVQTPMILGDHALPQRWLLVTRWSGPKGRRAVEFLRDVLPSFLERFSDLHLHLRGAPPEAGSEGDSVLRHLEARFPGRVRALGLADPLEPEFAKYGLILGGGRVAIAALLMGRACLAFGEAGTLGLVRTKRRQEAWASNFGDLALETSDASLDQERCRRDLDQFLAGQAPSFEERRELQEHARRDFSVEEVSKQVLEIYRSARLMKIHPRPLPVLMYHKIVEAPLDTPHRIFVTAATFRAHLETFRRRGLTSLTFQDLVDFKTGRRPLEEFPRRPFVLTFDDGYRNNLTTAAPLLREFGFKAVIYLLADSTLSANTWDEGAAPQVPLMTPAERQALAESGVFEIGSHGFRHERLPGMTVEAARQELRGSKEALEREFGREIVSFAFTYGDIDANSAGLAREAGYAYALNTDRGAIHIEEDPHSVFRVNVFPEDGPAAIAKKTAWWYRWRYRRKRGR